MSATPPSATDGHLTAIISTLPLVVRAIITTLCVVLGLYLLFGAVYGWRWLSKLGKERGNEESRPLVQGGLTGIFVGATAFAGLALLMTAAILSVQDEPSLSGAPLLVILVLPACIGAGLGGRWRWIADLCVGWTGGLSLTSLLAVSAHVKSRTARLIVLAIFLPASLLLTSLLSIPRLHCRRLAHRVGLALCSFTGAWLFVLGIDVFTRLGLLDAVTLFARDAGIRVATEAVAPASETVPTVVLWQDRRCQGLLAGAWLLSLVGTAFQIWRYSVLGDDPEHEWNSYLGTILSDEKTHRSALGVGHTPLLAHGRLGVFSKPRGRFSRLFSSSTARTPASYASRGSRGRGDMEAVPTLEMDDPYGGTSPHSAALGPSTSTRKAPARYDDAYAGVGLGLYDDPAYGEVHDDDRAYGNEKDPGYLYDAGHRPVYHPQHYLQRNGSEPSFRSVPAYDASLPPAFPDSPDLGRTPSLSGSTVLGGDTPHIGHGQSEGYDAAPGKQERSSGSLASHKTVADDSDKRRTSGPLKIVFGVSFEDHQPDSAIKPHRSGTRKAVPALSKLAEDEQTRSSNLAKAPTSPTRPKIVPRSTSASSSSSSSSVVSGILQRPSPALSLSGPVAPRPSPASTYSYSPVLPTTAENPYDQIAVQATPSLLNAIQRVSAAQKQAKEWRSAHAPASSPLGSPSLGDASAASKDRQGLGIGVPHRDAEVLRAAAQRRRQSSNSGWWNEVERKAQLRSSSGSSAS